MRFLGLATEKDIQRLWDLAENSSVHDMERRVSIIKNFDEKLEKHYVEKHLKKNYRDWKAQQERRREASWKKSTAK